MFSRCSRLEFAKRSHCHCINTENLAYLRKEGTMKKFSTKLKESYVINISVNRNDFGLVILSGICGNLSLYSGVLVNEIFCMFIPTSLDITICFS